MKRTACMFLFCASSAIACVGQTTLKSQGESIPAAMGLVTVVDQTPVYERPTLAAREITRLPEGRRVFYLAKGGEDRIIGAVYSSWYRVRLENGSRGWVFAGHLANVDENRPPYSFKRLIGAWKYGKVASGGAGYPSQLELKKDARFDFAGWRIKDFQSHGAWVYNNLENTLTLRFFDKREEWNDWITSADKRLYKAVAGYGKQRPTVRMEVERKGDGSPRRFNLLGTFFMPER